jgi:hypothetical protein
VSLLSLVKPIIGKPDSSEDVKLVNALTAIEAWANGQIDHNNLNAAAGITSGQIALLAITTGLLAKEGVTEEKLAKAVQEKLTSSSLKMEVGATPSYLSWGVITAAGVIQAGSGDFTVAVIGEHEFEIKWTKEKASASYSVVGNSHGAIATVVVLGKTKAHFIAAQYTPASAQVSAEWSFAVLAAS